VASHINWLREGDSNTKFFHRKAAWRVRKKNGLKDADGNWHTSAFEMRIMTTDYFQNIFSTDSDVNPGPAIKLMEKVTLLIF
jgi:hypothetical protein